MWAAYSRMLQRQCLLNKFVQMNEDHVEGIVSAGIHAVCLLVADHCLALV